MAATSREPGPFSLSRRTCLAAAAATLVWAPRAVAQVAGIELHWSAPARCPGADDVDARVRRLGGAADDGSSPKERLVADAAVVAMGGHFRLTLTVRRPTDAEGETRVLESASCESLAGAAAVTLALLARGKAPAGETVVSPGSAGAAPSSDSTSSVANAAPSAGSPSASLPSPAVADPSRTGPLALQVPVLLADAGVLPRPAYGLGVGAAVRVSRLLFAVAGALWQPQSAGGAAAYSAKYQRRSGELYGCYGWSAGPFDVAPCMTMAIEDVIANGSGANVTGQQGEVAWLTLGLGAQAGWRLTRWAAVFVRPGMRLTTSRPMFAIDGIGPLYVGSLYRVPLATAGVEVGSEWIF